MPPISGFDVLMLAVLGLSALAGAVRGMLRVTISLATWILAFSGSAVLAPPLLQVFAPFFTQLAVPKTWQLVLVYFVVFCAIMLIGWLVGRTLKRIVNELGLEGADQLLGFAFGLVRGVVMVLVIGFVITLTGFHQAPWWKRSLTAPWIYAALSGVRPYLPTVPTGKIKLSS